MARFKEALEALLAAGPGDDFSDQLTAAYDDDINELNSSAESASARIDELTAENVTLNQALQEQKARNWDLSQMIPQPDAMTNEEVDADEDGDDEDLTIDDLFGDDDEKDDN